MLPKIRNVWDAGDGIPPPPGRDIVRYVPTR